MAVYRLDPDSRHFHNFAPADKPAIDFYHRFDGTPLAHEWTPLEITAVDEDDELAVLGDHALLGTIPVFSEPAVSILSDFLEQNGELLPLVYSRGRYFAYNVTTVVNALDEDRSKLVRFSTGRVMSIEEYVFKQEALSDRPIFKIPELPRAYVFVTDIFVERVRAGALHGFDFLPVWDGSAVV